MYRADDFARFTGRPGRSKPLQGGRREKEFSQARLQGLIDENVVITDEKNNELNFPPEQVAKTRLAVVF